VGFALVAADLALAAPEIWSEKVEMQPIRSRFRWTAPWI